MTEQKLDAYANLITGLGGSRDKSQGSALYRAGDLSTSELDVLYEQDALAARIIDRIVDDAIRSGFDIEAADEGFDIKSIKSQVEDLQVLDECGDAWRWSRLYGGSLVFFNANDGKKMSEPLILDNVSKLINLQVLESPFVVPSAYNPGLGARAFRNPERYDVFVPFGSDSVRTIHRSRVVRFDGVRVPPTRLISRGGWGPSVLDRVIRELTQLGEVMGYARNVMHELSIMILKLDGFRDQVCGGPEAKAEIEKVIEAIRWAVDNLHTLALDKKDDYAESTRTVTGLADLLKMFVDALTRSTDYPGMVLLNQRAEGSGLANSAGSELANYYDGVDAARKKFLIPAINRALEIIFAARKRAGERIPTEWTITFPSLYQPTEKERSETELREAQRDQILLTFGVKSPDEARDERIRNGQIIPIAGKARGDAGDILDAVLPAIARRVEAGEFSAEDGEILARILGAAA